MLVSVFGVDTSRPLRDVDVSFAALGTLLVSLRALEARVSFGTRVKCKV